MRKYGDNMKCAFISVLMNLIYGEGPVHNFLPSRSTFKSVIHLCYPADVTTSLFILKYWTYSEWYVFLSLFNQLASCCGTLNSAQMIHMNDHWIRKIFLLSRNVVTSTTFMDNPRLPCYHWNTWFRWLIPGSSSLSMPLPAFPPAAPIPGGRGRLHPAFCQSWNLDRTFPVRAKQNSQKPPTSSGPSFGYDRNIMSAGRIVGWMTGGALLCDISSCDDVQILSWPLLLSLQETERKSGSPVLQRIQYLL